MSPDTSLGPLIRLWGLKRSQLPSPSATPDELTPFLTALLSEAIPFIDSASPKSHPSPPASPPPSPPWKPKSTKSFPASTAPVRLLERRIPSSLLASAAAAAGSLNRPRPPVGEETWACRLSLHEDRPAAGTASWAEFRAAIGDAHAESEDAFTPAVVAARRAVEWDCSGVGRAEVGVGAGVGEGGEEKTTWGGFTLGVVEMRHAVGRPVLRDRVFPVLQLTATCLDDGEELLVVSVTVEDFGEAPEAEHARAGDVVVASYASVERVRKITAGDERGKIEWIMATASDARGVLPAWVQRGAVPGQIAKDVSLFLGWIAKERTKGAVSTGQERGDGGGERHEVGDASGQGKMVTVVAAKQKALRNGMGAGGGAALQ